MRLEVVNLDQFTVIVPYDALDRVHELLTDRLGPHDDYGACGRKHFRSVGWTWGNGSYLAFNPLPPDHRPEDEHEGAVVFVTAQVLAAIEKLEDRWRLLSELVDLGGRPTRVDLAYDRFGRNLEAIDQCAAACARGELVGPRSYQGITSNRTRRGVRVPMGKTLYMGTHPKIIRIYDKGLETKRFSAGKWERIEVQFGKEHACQVYARIVIRVGEGERLAQAVRSAIFGAFEFREPPKGEGERLNVRRRELKPFYVRLAKSSNRIRTAFRRRAPSLEGYRRHIVNTKRSLEAVARRAHLTWREALDHLTAGDERVSKSGRSAQVGRELHALMVELGGELLGGTPKGGTPRGAVSSP